MKCFQNLNLILIIPYYLQGARMVFWMWPLFLPLGSSCENEGVGERLCHEDSAQMGDAEESRGTSPTLISSFWGGTTWNKGWDGREKRLAEEEKPFSLHG